MTSKITLYSDEALIKEIKRYAKEQNTSVSKIVNHFFKNLLQSEKKEHPKSSITDSLTGILKESSTEDYHKHLENKYL
jgi:predicted urease superfamily metal-dependent hydrolase